MRCALAASAVLIGLLTAPAVAQPSDTTDAAEEGRALLRDVQATYNALEGMRATFTQTVIPAFSEDSTRMRGLLLLQGNRYRVETSRETFVTNGRTTWIYAPADSQVVVNDAAQDPATVSPQTLFMDYTDRYRVEAMQTKTAKGTPHRVLSLVPTARDARFTSLRMWVRRDDGLVTRLRVEEAGGAVVQIEFDDLLSSPDVPPNAFTFDPPPGVDVVDLRSS